MLDSASTLEAPVLDAPTLEWRAPARGLGLAPITAMILLVAVNVVVLSTVGLTNTVLCGALVLIAIVSLRRPKLLLGSLGCIAGSLAVFALSVSLPLPGPLAYIGTIAFWMTRFAVAIVTGIYVLLTVRPSELAATLYALHIPRFLTIPLTVMLRFFPHARQEFRAIFEAMSLRGLPLGARALVLHPLRTLEFILVPMLVSCSRIADDLSASVLVRGLGSDHRPTTLEPLRLRLVDAVALLLLAGVSAVAITGVRVW